jgi:magnesium chelatase family protein
MRGVALIASIPSATVLGVEGTPVAVEVHVSNGLPGFNVVGLPDAACRESRDRVRAALLSSELTWPLKRVTVNLAPSSVRKGGAGLDLPIAVGLLVASEVLTAEAVAGCGFIGELGLDGSIRRVPGIVPLVASLATRVVVVPPDCFAEASVVGRHKVRVAGTVGELLAALRGDAPWPDPPAPGPAPPDPPGARPDLADVRGQAVGRMAVEVAAAGGHHLLLSGPPGAGKTMLARRLPGLLPALDGDDALTATRIHSAAAAALPASGLIERPPFRAPHHGASSVALIGGGSGYMRPGEISLSHAGVLFMDEMCEFPASVLDALRQPLEEGVVRVCRARATVSFPARFLLVGATNPCPCGEGGPGRSCRCPVAARQRYVRRLSGPLLDRFDLRVVVSRPDAASVLAGPPGECTAAVADRVAAARELAAFRGVRCNAELPAPRLDELAPLAPGASRLLEHRLRSGMLSARGVHRIRRVARSIADLGGAAGPLAEEHVCLALSLRAELAPAEEAA